MGHDPSKDSHPDPTLPAGRLEIMLRDLVRAHPVRQLSRETGISIGTISQFRCKGAGLYIKTVDRLLDYFGLDIVLKRK